MRPLEETERRILQTWSVALCVGSLLLVPLAARSSIDPDAQHELESRTLQLPDLQQKVRHSNVPLSRDPFTADPSPAPQISMGGAPGPSFGDSVTGATVRAGSPLGIILPPNDGAPGANAPVGNAGATVSAIITGDRPQALIYEGDQSKIVSIGDSLGGRRVRSIQSDGVILDDGTVLHFAEEHE